MSQLPRPSQVFGEVSTPDVQLPAAHCVPTLKSWHAPPWQVPSPPQGGVTVHTAWPAGEAMPLADGLHVPVPPPPPAWSTAEHAWHAPLQALLQQKPSAQKPLVHWSPMVHGLPSPCLFTHMPPLQ
jgi:hypothetical protein